MKPILEAANHLNSEIARARAHLQDLEMALAGIQPLLGLPTTSTPPPLGYTPSRTLQPSEVEVLDAPTSSSSKAKSSLSASSKGAEDVAATPLRQIKSKPATPTLARKAASKKLKAKTSAPATPAPKAAVAPAKPVPAIPPATGKAKPVIAVASPGPSTAPHLATPATKTKQASATAKPAVPKGAKASSVPNKRPSVAKPAPKAAKGKSVVTATRPPAVLPATGHEFWTNCFGKKALTPYDATSQALATLKLPESARPALSNRLNAWLYPRVKKGVMAPSPDKSGNKRYKVAAA